MDEAASRAAARDAKAGIELANALFHVRRGGQESPVGCHHERPAAGAEERMAAGRIGLRRATFRRLGRSSANGHAIRSRAHDSPARVTCRPTDALRPPRTFVPPPTACRSGANTMPSYWLPARRRALSRCRRDIAGARVFGGPPPASAEALAAVGRYRQADPQDSGGYGGVLLARALAHSGQFNEALAEALRVRERFREDRNFGTPWRSSPASAVRPSICRLDRVRLSQRPHGRRTCSRGSRSVCLQARVAREVRGTHDRRYQLSGSDGRAAGRPRRGEAGRRSI